jgi:hypothetical protein
MRYQSGVDLQVFDNASDLFPLAYLRLREDGTMSGHTSRNIFDGTYTYDPEGNIELTIIGMTRRRIRPGQQPLRRCCAVWIDIDWKRNN